MLFWTKFLWIYSDSFSTRDITSSHLDNLHRWHSDRRVSFEKNTNRGTSLISESLMRRWWQRCLLLESKHSLKEDNLHVFLWHPHNKATKTPAQSRLAPKGHASDVGEAFAFRTIFFFKRERYSWGVQTADFLKEKYDILMATISNVKVVLWYGRLPFFTVAASPVVINFCSTGISTLP